MTLETEVKLFAQCSTEIKSVAIDSQLAHLKKKKKMTNIGCFVTIWFGTFATL